MLQRSQERIKTTCLSRRRDNLTVRLTAKIGAVRLCKAVTTKPPWTTSNDLLQQKDMTIVALTVTCLTLGSNMANTGRQIA